MPTLRQERLAVALADPATKTKRQALLAAGYSPSTALENPGQITGSIGVARAREKLEAERADSARKMREFVGKKLSKKIQADADKLPVETLADLYGGFTKIANDYPDADEGSLTPQARAQARDYVKRVGARYARVLVRAALLARGLAVDAP